MLPYFLKQGDGNSIEFALEDKELIFFIPSIYFDRKYADIEDDNSISILGLFNYIIRDTKTGKDSEVYTFEYPTVFDCCPSSVVKIREMEYDGLVKDDYNLLKFVKGDVVIKSTKVIQDIANAELFYKMFTSGKVPHSIPYDKLHDIFTKTINLNGSDFGLNMQLFGIMIGESACVPGHPDKLFRHTAMKDFTDYNIRNIKLTPKYITPYTSYTSEGYDDSVIHASMLKNGVTSPMEKLFMGYE